jgi:hypothetical protein
LLLYANLLLLAWLIGGALDPELLVLVLASVSAAVPSANAAIQKLAYL